MGCGCQFHTPQFRTRLAAATLAVDSRSGFNIFAQKSHCTDCSIHCHSRLRFLKWTSPWPIFNFLAAGLTLFLFWKVLSAVKHEFRFSPLRILGLSMLYCAMACRNRLSTTCTCIRENFVVGRLRQRYTFAATSANMSSWINHLRHAHSAFDAKSVARGFEAEFVHA